VIVLSDCLLFLIILCASPPPLFPCIVLRMFTWQ
jgi:hypothetical protein